MATAIRPFERPGLRAQEECKVALVGFGTVGSAVARLLYARRDEHQLKLTQVFNRRVERKKAGWVEDDVLWTESFEDVLASDADVVVELIGGVNPAYEWVRRALEAGKSVVTANKQLIAHHGAELLQLARENRQHLVFGASVAGGVPVLSGLHKGLAGDRLRRVQGILNGTCNYILTRIERAGVTFAEALVEAQKAGFAEADPTDDVEGYDARAKLAILASMGLNAQAQPDQIATTGIGSVGRVDFDYAHELKRTIRQVSRAQVSAGELFAAVGPALVAQDSPLASVTGSQNMVLSTGEFGGDTIFSGYGAGGNPTAVAVVSDLLHLVRYRTAGVAELDRPPAAQYPVTDNFVTAQYVRFVVKDRPGIVAALAGAFAQHGLNIDSLLQKPGYDKAALPFVVTLEPCATQQLRAALQDIADFDFHVEAPVSFPMLGSEK
jgi:homoserine dehydrogenase